MLAAGIPLAGQEGRAAGIADAPAGALRVLCSTAFHFSPELLAAAEKAVGHKVVVEYGGVRTVLKEKMLKGQAFEVAISLPEVNQELFKAGIILPDTFEIGHDPIAFGLRGTVPAPNMGTPDAVKAALLKAASVKWTPQGFARDTAEKVLATLQIRSQIKDSSTRREEVVLGPGEYEIMMGPISEVLVNDKVKSLGLVIDAMQVPAQMQAVIGSHANDEKAARAFIAFMQTSPVAAAALEHSQIRKTSGHGMLK